MRNESRKVLTVFLGILLIASIITLLIILTTNKLEIPIPEPLVTEEKELIMNEPEVDLLLIIASGYEIPPMPDSFIKTRGFNPSKYIIDNRLKLDIEGEIYWIRLER